MSKPASKDLAILLYYKKWDDKENCFVDHLWIVVHGEKVLCQGIPRYPYTIFEPIKWSSHQKCQEWVDTGCIADIQEDLTNLNILFTEKFLKKD